jgi:gluconolactonase
LIARHDRTLVRYKDDKSIEILADKYEGKKLNSPNDITFYKDGSIYFSDPTFGLIGWGPKKDVEEQPYRGIYRLYENGKLVRVSQELGLPNGIDFSPDYSHLYVANSADGNIYAYDVLESGELRNLRLFAKQLVPAGKTPNGDGLKVDKNGNVYAASSVGVSVYSPNGKHIGDIELPKPASNLNFGGKENKTIFITARDKVYAIKSAIGK